MQPTQGQRRLAEFSKLDHAVNFSSLLDLVHQGRHGESSALAAASAAGKTLAILANRTSASKRPPNAGQVNGATSMDVLRCEVFTWYMQCSGLALPDCCMLLVAALLRVPRSWALQCQVCQRCRPGMARPRTFVVSRPHSTKVTQCFGCEPFYALRIM